MRTAPNRRLRARSIAPVALLGTLAATLTALPADAAPSGADRFTRLSALPSGTAAIPAPRHSAVAGTFASAAAVAAVARTTRIPATAAAPSSYVVQDGDTVSGIAGRFGLRTADVLAWNDLGWSSVIYPGQTLRLTAPAAAAPASPAPSAAAYDVRGGDTLSGIAQAHGVALSELFSANGLDWSSVIHPGQRISIPGAVVAERASNTTPAPAPAPAPEPAPAATHTVRGGDTLSAIAAAYGVSLAELFEANGLGWGSIIYPGQALSIPGGAPAAAPAGQAPATGLDAEQTENAKLIIRIGRELGVSDRGIAIALATAMVESWIRNLDWGDRDSLGLFQQRPSTGWGTPDEVRDASRAIKVFYGGPSDPNGHRTAGLLDIAGWEGMGFAQAAQSVQRSAFPERYAKWESAAYQWIAALG